MSENTSGLDAGSASRRPLGAFRTFAAWMAALFYLSASLYALGSGLAWWPKRLGEVALLTGLGGLCLVWLILPLSRLAWPRPSRAAVAARALALLAATLAALSGLVLPFTHIYSLFGYVPEAVDSTLNTNPFDSPVFWLATVGLLGPWLAYVSRAARTSLSWPPLLAGAGMTAGILALLVPLGFLDLPFAAAASVLFASVGGASLAIWLLLVSARTGSRGGLRIAAAVLVPLIAIVAGVELWAHGRLAERQKEWEADLAAERERVAALRMPVLSGAAEPCNAVERYLPLMESLVRSGYPDGVYGGVQDKELEASELIRAANGEPLSPLPEKLLPILEARRDLIGAFRDSLRCERVDWGFPHERGFEAPIPSLLGARWLASLTLLSGHQLAQAGDLQGAAEHYLDVMRFGADFESQGVLTTSLMGIALRDAGLHALGALLVSVEPGRLPLEDISARFGRIAAVTPSVAAGHRGDRMSHVAQTRKGVGVLLFDRLIGPPLSVYTLDEMLPLLRATERAAAETDPVAASAELGPAVEAAWASRNPIISLMVPSLQAGAMAAAGTRARQAIVQAALACEAAWQRDGRYPAEPAGLGGDPYAGSAKLRYRLDEDGRGYAVWSVGADREDDAGLTGWGLNPNGKDIVLARRPR
jgi:hypothetical protein